MNIKTNQKISSLIALGHELHSKPELSGEEIETSKMIIRELEKYKPDRIIKNVGGHGVVAIFDPPNQNPKKTILFRAELDALPLFEDTGLEYQSDNNGVMHACGHDGHMAILIGLAAELNKNRPENLRVILLFQPAEETGEGAQKVLNHTNFKQLEIDHGYALHNLPGYEENCLFIRSESFASASVGVEVIIKGKSSHAAYPEQGINPSKLISGLIQRISEGFKDISDKHSNSKYAVTFIRMGERAFGMSPGEARIGFTFRSETDEALNKCLDWFENIVQKEAGRFSGEITTQRVEPFAATMNSREGCTIVKSVAQQLGIEVEELESPFPWSEDFGRFGEKFPITLIGLGSGKDSAPLHSEMYDFNDSLLPAGIGLFKALVNHYSGS